MLTIHATGDLVLETRDSRDLLSASRSTLSAADVVIGQLEVPHTTATVQMSADVPAIPGPPEALDGVVDAGFNVLTLAGNHAFDFGGVGIADTRRHCAERGIATTGAGADIEEAWHPAIVERNGHRLAVLSVNCVGPRESRAGSAKPGCAYVDVVTHYEPRGANPGGPPRVFTFADPRGRDELAARIASAAQDAEVIVALHKGLVHQPVDIADYEYEIAHAAIDAGAIAVIAHHAHIMKGIEVYRGRPIFHGLGNFATVTHALGGTADDTPERRAWARERVRVFGFTPDPATPDYPFHPDSRNTAIAAIAIDDGHLSARVVPCRIGSDSRPVPLVRADGGEAVGTYIQSITRDAGLDTEFAWRDDELHITLAKETT